MIRLISISAILIFIGACASTSTVPEASAPAETAASASVDAVAPGNPTDPPVGDPQDLDTPQVVSASPENDPNELICRRERETGSKFSTKICRTRAEIEAREERDQALIREGRKIQTGGQCALSGDC